VGKDAPKVADIKIVNYLVLVGMLSLLVMVALPVSCGYCDTFSFAVIADPHVSRNPGHKAKFAKAVEWIIDNRESKDVELVIIVGDIAWGGPRNDRNLKKAKAILDNLNDAGIPYIPLIGDNEVETGCEKEFNEVFGGQYRHLASTMANWQKAAIPVRGKYLQNFSFDHKGCHFVCADFASRKVGDEGGELHNFEGGTWRWLKNDIEKCSKRKKENIVIMTHIGMFRTGFEVADRYLFSKSEMKMIKGFFSTYAEYVDSNYAGHIHQNWQSLVWTGLLNPIYHVRVTDETWYGTRWPESNDNEITVRWVRVDNSGSTISYSQHIKDVNDH